MGGLDMGWLNVVDGVRKCHVLIPDDGDVGKIILGSYCFGVSSTAALVAVIFTAAAINDIAVTIS